MEWIRRQDGELACVTLINSRGLAIELMSFGACLRKVSIPVAGAAIPLTLTLKDTEEYTVRSTGNCGKTLAPNAGEIGQGKGVALTDGTVIYPTANRGGNSLHGGAHAGNLQNWRLLSCAAEQDSAYAEFALFLPDGLDGWPGNRSFTVRYTLDENDTIRMDYTAKSDRATYVNMSNHTYWNLEQLPERAMEQRLFIDTEGMYQNGEDALPCGILSRGQILRESGVDLTKENRAGDLIRSGEDLYGRQIALGGGIDNGFLLRCDRRADEPACVLASADGRLAVELYTDAPAVVVYQAGGMKEGVRMENGCVTRKNCAIALEAQAIPNLEPQKPLLPGECFRRMIRYRIRW